MGKAVLTVRVDVSEDVPVVEVREEGIRLGQFLKLAGLADSGADAKAMLEAEMVDVDDVTETRRGRQLERGEVVRVGALAARVG